MAPDIVAENHWPRFQALWLVGSIMNIELQPEGVCLLTSE